MKKKNIIKVITVIIVSILILSSCASSYVVPAEDNDEGVVKTLKFDGKEMDYFRFGNKDGRKIIILPGLSLKSVMGSAEAIVAAYDIFADDYDVYLFDHIKEEPEGYTIEQMTQDTLKGMELLGLDHVNIIGVSLGGMIAEAMAIDYPEYTESIVLCSAASDIKDKTVLEEWRRLAEERDIDNLMISFGENIYTPSFYEQYKDIILASGQGASELDYQNFIISDDAILNFNISDQLDLLGCPVLVLGAGEDKVLGPESSLALAEKLHCEYYIYEGCGHGVYDEAPDYRARIKEFLDKH